MGLCLLYYVEYSLYNVKKVGFFYLGWNYTLTCSAYSTVTRDLGLTSHPKDYKYFFSLPAGDSNPQPVVTRDIVFKNPTLYLLELIGVLSSYVINFDYFRLFVVATG